MSNKDSITIREKTTAGIPFTLYSDDAKLDLSSSNRVIMNMVDAKNSVYRYSTLDSGAAIVVNSGTLGYVTFTPPTEAVFQYNRTPYKMYCWVYPTSGTRYSVPRDDYATINVLREY
jgi:hypothetical protein